MNQSFCQGTRITITIHTGKCLNMFVGQSLTPLLALGTQTQRMVPTSISSDPGPCSHGQRWSGLGSALVETRATSNPFRLSGGVIEGWLRGKHAIYGLLQQPGLSLKTPIQNFTRSFTDLRVRDQAGWASSHRMRNWICLLDFISLHHTA